MMMHLPQTVYKLSLLITKVFASAGRFFFKDMDQDKESESKAMTYILLHLHQHDQLSDTRWKGFSLSLSLSPVPALMASVTKYVALSFPSSQFSLVYS